MSQVGHTPLSLATKADQSEIVDLLVASGGIIKPLLKANRQASLALLRTFHTELNYLSTEHQNSVGGVLFSAVFAVINHTVNTACKDAAAEAGIPIRYDTRITATTNGSIKLVRRDKTVIIVKDDGVVSYAPRTSWKEQDATSFALESLDYSNFRVVAVLEAVGMDNRKQSGSNSSLNFGFGSSRPISYPQQSAPQPVPHRSSGPAITVTTPPEPPTNNSNTEKKSTSTGGGLLSGTRLGGLWSNFMQPKS
eukprot:gene25472-31938_t